MKGLAAWSILCAPVAALRVMWWHGWPMMMVAAGWYGTAAWIVYGPRLLAARPRDD